MKCCNMTEGDTRIPYRWSFLPTARPNLSDIRDVLKHGLSETFTKVKVSVVKCPNLTSYPFYFTAKGLGNNSEALELGKWCEGLNMESGERTCNIIPLLDRMDYTLSYIVGGSLQYKNSINNEHITNFMYVGLAKRGTIPQAFKLDARNHTLNNFEKPKCNIPANFYTSDGIKNAVLKVHVEQRKTNINFGDAMHLALYKGYGKECPVVLGGTFYMNNGVVKHEVTRRKFAPIDSIFYPYKSPFQEVEAPVIGVGTVYSFKSYGSYRFRGQRFYTVSRNRREGGLYCNDDSPYTTEYVGYFSVAEKFYCLDLEKTQLPCV